MTVPDVEAHAGLLADLETRLHVNHGLVQILDLEGGPVTLAGDLFRLVAADRGLASILGTTPNGPTPQRAEAQPGDRAEQIGPSKVRRVTAQERIMLRFGRSRRYLATMRRTVHDLLEELIAASPSDRSAGTGLRDVASRLHREYVGLSQAITALTGTVPTVADASRLTVLVVDDEPDLRDILVRMLRRCGLTTISASDHHSAIELCRNQHVDVLICDLVLPEAGDLVHTAIQLQPTIGIVCLSGFPDSVVIAEVVDDRVMMARPSSGEQLLMGVLTAVDRAGTRDAKTSPPAAEAEHVLKLSSHNLASLHEQISGRADTLGMEAHGRAVLYTSQLLQLLNSAWESACDFRGEDLTAARLESLEDLDGVHWTNETALNGPTLWPHDLEHAIREHSRRVPDEQAGVWEITLGTEVGAEQRPARARI